MTLHHLFLLLSLCQWGSSPFPWKWVVLSVVRILQHSWGRLCPLEPLRLDPAWVQRILLLPHGEQLLLSVAGTCPTVTVGLGSVARVLREEVLPTPPS